MILINSDKSNAKQFARSINKTNGRYISKSTRLQVWIDANPHHADVAIARDIKRNLKQIIKGTPKELEVFINGYNANGYQARIYDPIAEDLTLFGKKIKEIFNYKGFRQSKKAIWLSDISQIKSCSICNTQYTLKTIQDKTTKLLFHFDHYFPQSVYPYLSLSYYNLIPCCASCNMSKSNKPFTLSQNIHPYLESFHDFARFVLDKSSVANFLIDPNKNEEMIKYEIKIRAKYFGSPLFEDKLKNYLKEFRINEQYTQFKDLAAETYLRSKYYEKPRRREIKSFFQSQNINLSDELINRFILGNYYQDSDLLKRPLAKFTRDLGEEMGLI